MTGWKIHIFLIGIHLHWWWMFQPVMLVFGGVAHVKLDHHWIIRPKSSLEKCLKAPPSYLVSTPTVHVWYQYIYHIWLISMVNIPYMDSMKVCPAVCPNTFWDHPSVFKALTHQRCQNKSTVLHMWHLCFFAHPRLARQMKIRFSLKTNHIWATQKKRNSYFPLYWVA